MSRCFTNSVSSILGPWYTNIFWRKTVTLDFTRLVNSNRFDSTGIYSVVTVAVNTHTGGQHVLLNDGAVIEAKGERLQLWIMSFHRRGSSQNKQRWVLTRLKKEIEIIKALENMKTARPECWRVVWGMIETLRRSGDIKLSISIVIIQIKLLRLTT